MFLSAPWLTHLPRRLLAFFLVSLAVAFTSAQQADATPRTWTSADGRTMVATFLGMEGGQAVFKMANGQQVKLPLERLAKADQDLLKAASTVPTTATRLPSEKRGWPDTVEVPTRSIEVKVVEEDAAKRNYVYRSEFFQFTSQDKIAGSVMKEIARTFEATHSLVTALPWGVDPKPPEDLGYYQAKFYLNRRNYILDGGPENSGGVYFSRDRVFRVPFDSLGLKVAGSTWFMDRGNYSNATIIHEVTHQMMHDFLPFLPIWAIEGTAEYVELLPYNAGKFLASSHERGIKEYVKEASESGIALADIGPVADHMNLTTQRWHNQANSGAKEQRRLYFASCVLVYYFNHLDGDGKGTRFLKYMDSMAEARAAWKTFFTNPEVKRGENGSYTFPSTLKVPEQSRDEEFGIQQIKILLDGRTPQQLDEDVKAGFKKIGLRW